MVFRLVCGAGRVVVVDKSLAHEVSVILDMLIQLLKLSQLHDGQAHDDNEEEESWIDPALNQGDDLNI